MTTASNTASASGTPTALGTPKAKTTPLAVHREVLIAALNSAKGKRAITALMGILDTGLVEGSLADALVACRDAIQDGKTGEDSVDGGVLQNGIAGKTSSLALVVDGVGGGVFGRDLSQRAAENVGARKARSK